jgi:hypothetical protein
MIDRKALIDSHNEAIRTPRLGRAEIKPKKVVNKIENNNNKPKS